MRYADANIIVRFILKDNKEMAQIATDAIFSGDVFVSPEVFAEVVYVLRSVYNTERKDISNYLSQLLDFVNTFDTAILKEAFSYFAESKLDFVDCILAAHKIVGKREILSFDKKLNNFIKRKEAEQKTN